MWDVRKDNLKMRNAQHNDKFENSKFCIEVS